MKPQLWRHALEACAEDYVTGSQDWSCHAVGWLPLSDGSPDWSRDAERGDPSLHQYSVCASRIARWLCNRCHPWELLSSGAPLLELRAEGERIVGDVAPVADGQEDLVETFLDFILERMVAEALLVRVGGDGDEERLRLDGEVALSLASMSCAFAARAR